MLSPLKETDRFSLAHGQNTITMYLWQEICVLGKGRNDLIMAGNLGLGCIPTPAVPGIISE